MKEIAKLEIMDLELTEPRPRMLTVLAYYWPARESAYVRLYIAGVSGGFEGQIELTLSQARALAEKVLSVNGDQLRQEARAAEDGARKLRLLRSSGALEGPFFL